jgi:hypothetical protein
LALATLEVINSEKLMSDAVMEEVVMTTAVKAGRR